MFELRVPDPHEASDPTRAVARAEAGSPALTTAQREAQRVLSVDLADPESRSRARLVIDILQGSGASANRSRLLSKRILTLAQADPSSNRIADALQALASRVQSLGIPRTSPQRQSLLGRLFGSRERRESIEEGLERLKAQRAEIERIIAILAASAEVLRQNEVALGQYEEDIVAESRRINDDIGMAEEFEPALVAAIAEARAGNAPAPTIRFAEREVLFPLEQQRQQLQTLLAVNQQATLSLTVLRETNQALIAHVRAITWATRHALDTATVLDRTLKEQRLAQLQAESGASGDAGNQGAAKSLSAMSELQMSIDELFTALENHDVWQEKAVTRTNRSLDTLQCLSTQAFEGADARVPC